MSLKRSGRIFDIPFCAWADSVICVRRSSALKSLARTLESIVVSLTETVAE